MRNVRHALDVGHGSRRIADRFQPDQARPIVDRGLDLRRVGGVDGAVPHSRPLEDGGGEADHATVDGTRHDDLVTGRQQREDHAVHGRHAGGGDERGVGALQFAKGLLERSVRRIRIPRVGVTGRSKASSSASSSASAISKVLVW